MTKIQEQIEQRRTDFKRQWAKLINKYNEAEFDRDFDDLIRLVAERCHLITKGTQSGVNPDIDLTRKHLANDIAHEFQLDEIEEAIDG